MPFSKIPTGTRLFLDANVQVYHFLKVEPLGQICHTLFQRIGKREIEAFTSADVAAHVIHRVMVAEAIAKFSLPPNKAISYLKTHPQAIQELQQYKVIPREFSLARIHILDLTYREIHNSKQFRDKYGLLTNDSLILAMMTQYKLTHLATNDNDFKRVSEIKIWMPRI